MAWKQKQFMHFGHFYVAKAIYALLAHFCRKNDLPALSGKFLPFIFCRPESFEFLCLCYRYYVWILWMLRMLWILWILVWHNPSIKYLAEVPSKMHFVGPTRFIMPLENLLIYFFLKKGSPTTLSLSMTDGDIKSLSGGEPSQLVTKVNCVITEIF